MDFSVIVPAFNEERRIAACLESIRAQRTRHSYEVIVSDSNSTDRTASIAASYADKLADRTASIAASYADKLVVCRERGTARARNEGARLACGDILAFIDSDTVIMPDYLDTVYETFRDKRTLAVSCAFKFTNRRPKLLAAEYATNAYYILRSLCGAATLPGFNVCIRRGAFERVGGFRLCHLEDLDMSIKLRQIGKTVYLSRRLAVTSSRRLEQDGIAGTLKYYMDLFEASQNRRLGFHVIKLKRSQYNDYVHRE
ncbi:Glycosyltransferase [Methanocella conradii HZ254]|uniref:Glycosyltransferase n=2 Tax=Methanocella TaxID=570266 RepID=H8I517_METCZ|nr:Glycosyltransferase [Methanocella conradii HZ254]